MIQGSLFEITHIAIKRAEDSANRVHDSWTEKAYQFLLRYAKNHGQFMAEDIRIASRGIVPPPPSKRAWGGIIVRAKRNNIIKKIGHRSVKNERAHMAVAGVWQSLIY